MDQAQFASYAARVEQLERANARSASSMRSLRRLVGGLALLVVIQLLAISYLAWWRSDLQLKNLKAETITLTNKGHLLLTDTTGTKRARFGFPEGKTNPALVFFAEDGFEVMDLTGERQPRILVRNWSDHPLQKRQLELKAEEVSFYDPNGAKRWTLELPGFEPGMVLWDKPLAAREANRVIRWESDGSLSFRHFPESKKLFDPNDR